MKILTYISSFIVLIVGLSKILSGITNNNDGTFALGIICFFGGLLIFLIEFTSKYYEK